MAYVVTGGTGFIGRRLVAELAKGKEPVHVLVRNSSAGKLKGAGRNVKPLAGDITEKNLGVARADLASLKGAEVFHLAAVYDLEADEAANQAANVEGTRNAVAFANAIKARRLHHVSSIAVAGAGFKGDFTEDMFDEGQKLDQPYYRTKFEAEKIVREEARIPFRIYRPGIVIGSSADGQADRSDGPYYAFKLLQRVRDAIPSWWPLVGYEGNPLNVVPVDFVAAAIAAIAAKPGLDGKTFHIVDPEPLSLGDTVNIFLKAAHGPQFTLRVDPRAVGMVPKEFRGLLTGWKPYQALRRQFLDRVKIPEAALGYVSSRARFKADNTQAALKGTGIAVPPLKTYGWRIWDYWERHLDPEALTPRNLRGALENKVVVVTGASSGIGRATAVEMGRHGARMMLVSRTKEKLEALASEIKDAGGKAWVYPTDLADMDANQRTIERVLKEHGQVDILVNNAGRSIRRSVKESLDRFHDYERTMQLNYFGAVKLMLAVIPGMKARGSGHIINISSIGVQAYPPRFGAYVASKSALAALARCIAPEVADDGIVVTNIHMPLVRTPMIAPTGMYKNFPTISSDEAAEMVVQAVLTQAPEVSTRLGKLGEAVDTISPGFLNFVMTGAYHVFPDSEHKDGHKNGRKARKEDEEMPVEQAALAYLMRGVHF
ncbi:MAG TPA: SDR family oxidoreductase [Candidatus Dormibacteraeota bacterium]|jgi:NAD(P)-dependent dehydrogenase (short-subunit alcohol dehydrogenase family)